MTDEEIQALERRVCEWLGIELVRYHTTVEDSQRRWMTVLGEPEPPPVARDWAALGLVLAKLKDQVGTKYDSISIETPGKDGDWWVRLRHGVKYWRGETLPLAVCLAVDAMKGPNDPEL